MKHYKLWIAGEWQTASASRELRSPFSNEVVAKVDQASAAQMESAIAASRDAFAIYRKSSRYLRSQLLLVMAEGIRERRVEIIDAMAQEAGKPTVFAEVEVSRALVTFTTAAEEAKRFGGDV